MCKVWMRRAIAYMEMPEENTVIVAKEMAFSPRVSLVEAQTKIFGHRAGPRAVVEGHHEDPEKDHSRDRPDPVKMAGRDAVFCARGGHPDHFLRAEVGRQECQPANPGWNGPARQKKSVLVFTLRLSTNPMPSTKAKYTSMMIQSIMVRFTDRGLQDCRNFTQFLTCDDEDEESISTKH